MIYYKSLEDFLFFIHIPRTGGRYISEQLIQNDYIRNVHGSELYYARELMHLDRRRYSIYYKDTFKDVNNIDNSFAVIRNPVDRFISSLFFVHDITGDLNKLDDYNTFVYYMDEHSYKFQREFDDFIMEVKGLSRLVNNWFTHQVDFIQSNTKLWKYENRLDEDFFDWLNRLFNTSITVKNIEVKVRDYDNNREIISNKLIDNIQRYYEKDLKLWESL